MKKLRIESVVKSFENHYKEPIITILDCLSRMEDEQRENPDALKSAQKIRNHTIQLSRGFKLVEDHAKLTHGLYEHKCQCVDLVRFVRGIVRTAAPYALRNGVSYTYKLPKEPIITITEIEPLTVILGHLLSNACRFNEPNDVINIDLHRRGNTAFIMVWDWGPGISKDVQPHIFEPNYSYSPDGAPFAGNGLGLTVARELAQFLGGDLKYVPNYRGSLFTLVLPLRVRKRPRLKNPPIPKEAIAMILSDSESTGKESEKNSVLE